MHRRTAGPYPLCPDAAFGVGLTMKIADESQLLAAIRTGLPAARRVVAFAPHPDDEIFGCGGALALLQATGAAIQIHVLTDGARGGSGDAASLVARREAESQAAARLLGLPAPSFWRLPDRGLVYGEPLIEGLRAAVAAADADLILLPAVTEVHPDHQTLALAGAEALRRLGGERHAAFYEIGATLPAPNLLIDISSLTERKQQAMQAFASQLQQESYAARISGLNCFRAHLLAPEATSAEAFLLVTVHALADGLERLFDGPVVRRRRMGHAVSPADLPLVSVIVRSIDRDSLTAALDSLACQSYPHIEVVVVNAVGAGHRPLDGGCGPFPLRLVAGDGPLARSRAANVGLEHARGEFLIFLDDDDRFYPGHIAVLVDALMTDALAVAAYAAVQMVDKAGAEVGILADPFDRIQLCIGNYLPIHAVLFRRGALDRGVSFDESFDLCEDWDFWLQLASLGAFRRLDRVGAVYHINDTTGSRVRADLEASRRATVAVYRKWLPLWDDATLLALFDYAGYKQRLDGHALLLATSGFSGDNLAELIGSAVATRDRLQQLCNGQQGTIAELQGTIAELQGTIDELRESNEGLDAALRQADENLATLLASRSWRLTAPLRALAGAARGVLGVFQGGAGPSHGNH
ncbi:MAG: PIG-L family deacetylase [Desulfuromonadales bacterium]|nr:PIG-L family deacetylase [Desulfuromonadales bacterium]